MKEQSQAKQCELVRTARGEPKPETLASSSTASNEALPPLLPLREAEIAGDLVQAD